MHKKIALTGAHGTGKTTLLAALSKFFKNQGESHLLVPEIPRIACQAAGDPEFFRRGFNSLNKQLMLLFGQVVYESTCGKQTSLLICDRTVIDHLAYTRVLFGEELKSSQIDMLIEDFAVKHSKTYDEIFYLPIEFPPVDDGIRESDILFQRSVDNEIRALLDANKISVTTVSGTVEERASLVFRSIGF